MGKGGEMDSGIMPQHDNPESKEILEQAARKDYLVATVVALGVSPISNPTPAIDLLIKRLAGNKLEFDALWLRVRDKKKDDISLEEVEKIIGIGRLPVSPLSSESSDRLFFVGLHIIATLYEKPRSEHFKRTREMLEKQYKGGLDEPTVWNDALEKLKKAFDEAK